MFDHAALFATPGIVASSVHGILQARILEWVDISSYREPLLFLDFCDLPLNLILTGTEGVGTKMYFNHTTPCVRVTQISQSTS